MATPWNDDDDRDNYRALSGFFDDPQDMQPAVYTADMNSRFAQSPPDVQSATYSGNAPLNPQNLVTPVGYNGVPRQSPSASSGLGFAGNSIDAAKSLGIGAVNGTIDLAALPGNVVNFSSAATDYLGNKIGLSPDTIKTIKNSAGVVLDLAPGGVVIHHWPTSNDIRNNIEGVTGQFYEPQTGWGRFAEGVGEALPLALAGPDGLLTAGEEIGPRLLGKALVNAVAPSGVSELAGKAFSGTPLEQPARAIGEVIGTTPSMIAAKAAQKMPWSDLTGEAAHDFSAATKQPDQPIPWRWPNFQPSTVPIIPAGAYDALQPWVYQR